VTASLVLFEDGRWPDLAPLTDLLPVPALAFGGSTLGERWASRFGGAAMVEARASAFADGTMPRPAGGSTIFVANAAALPGPWVDEALARGEPSLLVAGDRVAGAIAGADTLRPGLGRGEGFAAFLDGLKLPRREVRARIIDWPWRLIEWNDEAIAADLATLDAERRGTVHDRAVLERPERIRIRDGARIDALAVLDAREGPILVGRDVVVAAHTVVQGPCVIRRGTQLLGGMVGRSTIGPGCRIAGEVDETIWQGWSNKRHHGFVGHSLIGEWSNLGALTTTSDLKNNYGTIRAFAAGGERDTGLIKLGAIVGAGVKTGIGTLLPTGAVIGTGSHLFGGGRYAPKHLPAFAWWDGEHTREYQIDKFIATARTAMQRRDQTLDAGRERALLALFDASARDRQAASRPLP
jgi:UDP-N-acetylglucosamine diphosphorylase / glucose-1-phosphate thymidylyltransferase / UDP-N-acetylgalactosamine diphosphorylase / glucosamine-1-phosphate N-acetyltransferase / galactosamine-1-phosphate N-acetyltransferase